MYVYKTNAQIQLLEYKCENPVYRIESKKQIFCEYLVVSLVD